mmetsp:Transcript_17583/g.57584  ORF Transcript_17583/g.57584 Transcript_17583/m.57584 type:complete len:212 (+) Transcript_17583:147-782(+)
MLLLACQLPLTCLILPVLPAGIRGVACGACNPAMWLCTGRAGERWIGPLAFVGLGRSGRRARRRRWRHSWRAGPCCASAAGSASVRTRRPPPPSRRTSVSGRFRRGRCCTLCKRRAATVAAGTTAAAADAAPSSGGWRGATWPTGRCGASRRSHLLPSARGLSTSVGHMTSRRCTPGRRARRATPWSTPPCGSCGLRAGSRITSGTWWPPF